MITIPSLIKWSGGKRSQAARIAALFPRDLHADAVYYEPFLGGGALLWHAAHRFARVVCGDVYAPLIALWRDVLERPAEVSDSYRREWERLQADFPAHYYDVRARFNANPTAAGLCFLSRTCVNGIIRFNAKGAFNSSVHLSRRGMRPAAFAAIVDAWSARLRLCGSVEFRVSDYAETVAHAGRGDFVYLDPPYANSHNRYVADLDVPRLVSVLRALNARGVRWALSFDGRRGDHDMTYALPRDLYARHELLDCGGSALRRVLHGVSERVCESLYLNY